jgi:hypothetical protein
LTQVTFSSANKAIKKISNLSDQSTLQGIHAKQKLNDIYHCCEFYWQFFDGIGEYFPKLSRGNDVTLSMSGMVKTAVQKICIFFTNKDFCIVPDSGNNTELSFILLQVVQMQ